MVGETLLQRDELHKWWNIETSIGRKQSQAQKYVSGLYSFFDSFSDSDKQILENLIHTNRYWISKPQAFDITLLRLVLIKRFIENNRPGVMKE